MVGVETFDGQRAYIDTYVGGFTISSPADHVMKNLKNQLNVLSKRCARLRRDFAMYKTARLYEAWARTHQNLEIVRADIKRHANLYCIVNRGYSLN